MRCLVATNAGTANADRLPIEWACRAVVRGGHSSAASRLFAAGNQPSVGAHAAWRRIFPNGLPGRRDRVVNSVEDMLRVVVEHLDAVQIPYMVVGSLASSAYGKARTTFDADIVIASAAPQLDQFISRIERGFYVNRRTAQQAVAARSMFNIVDLTRGCKADLIVLSDEPFGQSEFARRRRSRVAEYEIWTASPEDIVLSKLNWSKMGDSERQYRDAFAVAAIQRDVLDLTYLRQWAIQLNVEFLLE